MTPGRTASPFVPEASFGAGSRETTLACNSLDEFLVLQSGEGRRLLTEQADEGVRHGIPHGFDAFLKPCELALNLRQFFACF